jgi:predicted transcriptional regulator
VPDKNAKKILRILGNNLRRLRNGAGLSQDMLAVKADVTKRYVQMIEAGQKCPTLFTLKRLQSTLACRYEDLLAGF